jgi:hypothetical protein
VPLAAHSIYVTEPNGPVTRDSHSASPSPSQLRWSAATASLERTRTR